MSAACPPPPPPSSDYPHYSREPFLRPWARETGRRQISPGPAGRLPVAPPGASPEYRTPFQWCPKTVRHQPGTLSDMNRNGVRQKSERCPAEIGTLSDRNWNQCPTAPGIRMPHLPASVAAAADPPLSVLFDLLGSLICAFVVFKAHALIFRPDTSEEAPH